MLQRQRMPWSTKFTNGLMYVRQRLHRTIVDAWMTGTCSCAPRCARSQPRQGRRSGVSNRCTAVATGTRGPPYLVRRLHAEGRHHQAKRQLGLGQQLRGGRERVHRRAHELGLGVGVLGRRDLDLVRQLRLPHQLAQLARVDRLAKQVDGARRGRGKAGLCRGAVLGRAGRGGRRHAIAGTGRCIAAEAGWQRRRPERRAARGRSTGHRRGPGRREHGRRRRRLRGGRLAGVAREGPRRRRSGRRRAVDAGPRCRRGRAGRERRRRRCRRAGHWRHRAGRSSAGPVADHGRVRHVDPAARARRGRARRSRGRRASQHLRRGCLRRQGRRLGGRGRADAVGGGRGGRRGRETRRPRSRRRRRPAGAH